MDAPANYGAVTNNAAPDERPSISTRMAVFLVVNYMIGSGILNSPRTFKDSGIAATTALYALACLAVWVGSVVLVKAAEEQEDRLPPSSQEVVHDEGDHGRGGNTSVVGAKNKYALLAEESLGENGPYIIDSVIAVQNGGAVCSYVVVLGALATSLLSELLEWRQVAPAWWASFYVVMPLVVLGFVQWPSSWASFNDIVPLAVLSLGTISCLLLFVMEKWALRTDTVSSATTVVLDAPLVWWNWGGFFRKVGSVVFGLTFAQAAFHAYDPMKKRDLGEWKNVVTTSVLVGGAMCYLMGLFGYLSFGSDTEGDILDNFQGGWIASILKCCVVGHLVCYIPGEAIVLRDSMCGLFDVDKTTLGDKGRRVSTFFILATIVGAVIVLTALGLAQGEAFGYILDLTGGVTGSLTSFVLPAFIYLKGSEQQSRSREGRWGYRLASKILLVFGAALILVVLSSVFHNPFATFIISAVVLSGLFSVRATITAP